MCRNLYKAKRIKQFAAELLTKRFAVCQNEKGLQCVRMKKVCSMSESTKRFAVCQNEKDS